MTRFRSMPIWPLLAAIAFVGCGGGSTPAGPHCGDGACTFGEFCAVCPADCDCETLAATPPMGWNTWNRFGCDIDEELIRQTADALVESGMRDAGYVYLNLDDCWQIDRAADGTIMADPERFPSGMAALADYVHARGLKFGLYTCAGTMTCQQRPGSYLHEAQDAATYASWGVDYLKVDWCFTDGLDPRQRYAAMQDGIIAAGRPIIHSICNWGVDDPHLWGPGVGQLWRTTGDITDLFISAMANFRATDDLSAFAWPGAWNDPDMLEVGNGGMTEAEYRTHMALWAIVAAPLIAGNDLRAMDESTRAILLNPEAIAVDQDPWGIAGVEVADDVYARPVALPGGRAVVLANFDRNERRMTIAWEQLGLAAGPAEVRDLWARADRGVFADRFTVAVAPHDAALLLVSGSEHTPPPGVTYLSDLPWMHAANSRGPVERDRSVGGSGAGDGLPLSIDGTAYSKGLGVGGGSIVMYHLGGGCSRLQAIAGIDAESGDHGSVAFEVWADGERLFDFGVVTSGMPGVAVDVGLSGKRVLILRTTPAGDSLQGDLADWADARLTCN